MVQKVFDNEMHRYVVLFTNGNKIPFTTYTNDLKDIDIELQIEFGDEYLLIEDLIPWEGPFIRLAS